jgi:rare lipoprotein A
MRMRSTSTALIPGLLLAGCASHPVARGPNPPRPPIAAAVAPDGGPIVPPDISQIPEPIPKLEAPSQYGNKSPYNVLGETYRVLPSARGYVERGIASWYGTKFHGHLTSTFEAYDMYQFTAAHKTLPLPTYARVTNLENGRSIVVRINDRGPFVDNRLIDLSFVAAIKLGIWQKGTGVVEVRALDAAHPEPPPALAKVLPKAETTRIAAAEPAVVSAVSSVMPAPRIYLQVGAFGERGNAERVAAQVAKAGLGQSRIVTATVNARSLHRVQVGPLADVDTADRVGLQLRRLGLGAVRVAIDD